MSEAHEAVFRTVDYSLNSESRLALARTFLERRPLKKRTGTECFLVAGNDPFANAARSLEREVFEEMFADNDVAFMNTEYNPYEAASRFFVSIDVGTKEPVGVLRLIMNNPAGFKTLNDVVDLEVQNSSMNPISLEDVMKFHGIDDLDTCVDAGTVAVKKPYRKTQTPVQLYRSMYKYVRSNHKRHIVAAVDAKPLEKMVTYLGIPFVPLCGSKSLACYGSSSTQFVYGDAEKFFPKMFMHMFSRQGVLAWRHSWPLVLGAKDRRIHL